MTDRINTLCVVLEKPIRVDDAEDIITAIEMIRGVTKVEANIANPETYAADIRARRELGDKLWSVLFPNLSIS